MNGYRFGSINPWPFGGFKDLISVIEGPADSAQLSVNHLSVMAGPTGACPPNLGTPRQNDSCFACGNSCSHWFRVMLERIVPQWKHFQPHRALIVVRIVRSIALRGYAERVGVKGSFIDGASYYSYRIQDNCSSSLLGSHDTDSILGTGGQLPIWR